MTNSSHTRDPFWLGDWLVEPSRNRISGPSEERLLDPRTMQVLLHLAVRQGEVVTKDELMEAVWENVIVTDNALARTVSRLRTALDDDWRRPRYIETISKNGYRLIPQRESLASGDSLPSIVPTPVLPRKRSRAWVGLAFGGVAVAAAFLWPRSGAWTPAIQNVRTLSALPGLQPAASISPDGSMATYAWRAENDWDLAVIEDGGAGPVAVTQNDIDEGFASWSRDGRRLLFIRRRGATGCDLFTVSLLDRTETWVGDCLLNPSATAWSPDGQLAAVTTSDSMGKPRSVWLYDLETGDRTAITNPPQGTSGDTAPVFSPDGQVIAFRRIAGPGNADIWTVPVAGGETTQHTFDERIILGQDWSPDGGSLVFSSNRAGRRQIWTLHLGSATLLPWPIQERTPTYPTLARDGSRMLYTRNIDQTDIYRFDLGDSTISAVAASTLAELHPAIAQRGDRVAFISNRAEGFELWSSALDGSESRRHSSVSGALISAPTWSPDGQTIAFDAYRGAEPEILLARSDGARAETLAADGLNPAYSADGESLYFGSDRSGNWEVWRMPAGGGSPVQVTRSGAYRAQESLDGSALYYTKLATVGLFRSALDGSGETLVTDLVGLPDWGSWAVGRNGLYYVGRGPTCLHYLDFATGEATALLVPDYPVPAWGPSLALAPDESWLLFAQIVDREDELMIVDLAR